MVTKCTKKVIILGVGLLIIVAAGLLFAIQHLQSLPERFSSNSILVIEPYRYAGTWVFDDPSVGLVREPFVAGIPGMIDKLVSDIPDANNGFRLTFSAVPFPGYREKLV